MADYKLKADTGLQTVIDTGATLSDGSRAAADYDNSSNLDPLAVPYLQVQYDSGPPTAGDVVALLYNVPGDGESSEAFPDGGDGTTGTDDDPQKVFLVAVFETINPSTSVDEILSSVPFRLYPDTNRFVLKNTSGQTFDATWELRIKPIKRQITA